MNSDVARALVEARVLKFGAFTYVSGKRGPIYVDIRVLPSHPKAFNTVCEKISEEVGKLGADVIAGAETAGIPLSAVVANKLGKPMVYVRKKPKGYGTSSKIEGLITKESKAVLIDDMITDGGSKLSFIEGLRDAGAKIEDTIVVLDREQGGAETLKKEGVKLHSLITLKELIDYSLEEKILDEKKHGDIIGYLKDPSAWEANNAP